MLSKLFIACPLGLANIKGIFEIFKKQISCKRKNGFGFTQHQKKYFQKKNLQNTYLKDLDDQYPMNRRDWKKLKVWIFWRFFSLKAIFCQTILHGPIWLIKSQYRKSKCDICRIFEYKNYIFLMKIIHAVHNIFWH